MHIPDGYIGIQTSLPALGFMIPVWTIAARKVKKVFEHRQLPLLALCSAFSFVIMMFNIPMGVSSVHAVGSVFIAVLLGPWAACIAASTALIIQAVVFGDGGILAIGANCFNIAFIMPFTGYYIYRAISGKSSVTSKRSMLGIFTGAYAGLNAAAFLTAFELGIQPMLFKTAEGIPLYGYYDLGVAIPTVMLEHIFIAGPVEGIITVLSVAYIARFAPHLFMYEGDTSRENFAGSVFARYKGFIAGIAVLIILVPAGLLSTGTAWGEWGVDELKGKIGFVPEGMTKLSNIWSAVMPDYSIPGLNKGFLQSSAGYIISAAAGILAILIVMFISSKLIAKKTGNDD